MHNILKAITGSWAIYNSDKALFAQVQSERKTENEKKRKRMKGRGWRKRITLKPKSPIAIESLENYFRVSLFRFFFEHPYIKSIYNACRVKIIKSNE